MFVCICSGLNEEFTKKTIVKHTDEVRAATTDKRAAGVVWRAMHPVDENGHHKTHCGTCVSTIIDQIEQTGVRSEHPKAPCSNTCGTSGVCASAPCLSV